MDKTDKFEVMGSRINGRYAACHLTLEVKGRLRRMNNVKVADSWLRLCKMP